MTNLSTSEVLEKYAPEFVDLDLQERNALSDPISLQLFFSHAGNETRELLDTLAQTLLKLERAKEALREISQSKDCFASVGDCQFCSYSAIPKPHPPSQEARTASAALAYIEEGKE